MRGLMRGFLVLFLAAAFLTLLAAAPPIAVLGADSVKIDPQVLEEIENKGEVKVIIH